MSKVFPISFLIGWLIADITRGTMHRATPVIIPACLIVQVVILAIDRFAQSPQHRRKKDPSRFDIDREGIRFYGRGFMGGIPWPWRVHKHWQWHAGRGRFKSSSGLILHAMNYGIITPFVQVLAMVPEREAVDYITLPWHLLRYAFAWCWSEAWRAYLKVKYWHLRKTNNYRHLTQPGHGRHTDPDPILCPACLWGGARRWLVHTYEACGVDDVAPCDECPRCGTEL